MNGIDWRSVAQRAQRALVAALVGFAAGGCGGAESPRASDGVSSTTARPPATTTTLSSTGLLDVARRSLVRVRNTGCGELSVGSSWMIAGGDLVTNRHVVEDYRTIELLTWDGIDLSPDGVAASDSLDLARLHGDWSAAPGLRPLPLRADRVQPGERIFIVGFPEGEQLAVSAGVADGYGPEPDTPAHEVLKLTTIIKPGNSGGPALDSAGRVVGVAFAEEVKTDEALVIPIQALEALPASAFHSVGTCR